MVDKITAIEYAEQKLGVHSALKEVLFVRTKMDDLLEDIITIRAEKRKVEGSVSDYELDITTTERGYKPDLSATAFKEHMRTRLQTDPILRELKAQVQDKVDALDIGEKKMRMFERDIQIGCARMSELGGYLNYLAAVKNAAVKQRDVLNGEGK